MENIVSDKNRLFAAVETKCHHLKVDENSDDVLKVWVKEPTWLQVEQALGTLMKVDGNQQLDINMDKMYRYMIENFIDKTEPHLSTVDLLRLTPFVGNQLKEILPNPFGGDMGVDEGKAE